MRIVHVASGREWRGGQRQVWLLARSLARLGVDQVVVTGAGSELAARLQAADVPTRAVRWTISLDPRVVPVLLAEARRRDTILHAHDSHALSLADLAARWTGSRLVVTRRVDLHLRNRVSWRRADRVIAISEAVATVLHQDGIAPERVTVIPSGIPVAEVQRAAPLGIRARLGLDESTPLAVHVGALVPHKDQRTLITAAGRLRVSHPDLRWVVAGEGESRAELEQQIAGLGLGERVHLLGHVADPIRLIADATLFAMSSLHEGLGTSILDAMARGIPIAATAVGGIPELLQGGAGLLVPPGDAAALAGAVSRILDDPPLRSRLAGMATQRVQRFSDMRMAEALVPVYRSLDQSH